MKILAITSHNILHENSGTPKHIFKIVSSLAARDFHVIVLYLNFQATSPLVVKKDNTYGIDVYEIPFIHWFLTPYKLIQQFQPQACIAFTNGAACRFLPVLLTTNLPLLYEIHTVFKNSSFLSPNLFLYEQLEKLVCKFTSHLVVLGQQVKDIYIKQRQLSPEKISVIYPSVNVEEFPTSLSVTTDKQTITVTYIGNLIYVNHGIKYLLEAAKLVCRQMTNINFKLVGEPNNAREHYQQELEGIEDKVEFLHLENSAALEQILADSDILVHTRIYSLDNLSVQSKLAVYMAAEKPIVATDFADYQYLVQERGCGYAVKLDAESIAQAILQLANNPELRDKMAKNSRQTAMEYFNLDSNIEKYIQILHSIC